ncbi:MAG: ABC transporter substrate-binding protein [Gorillibacterium sp.]|nr:ABC transporter substrate-binding protein [Gorillibacterium sp.]
MKKWLSVLLILTMASVLLAACGSKTDEASPAASATANDAAGESGSDISGKIVFLSQHTDMVDTEFVDYAKRFQEKYPNAEVEFQATQDYEKTLKIRMASGDFPDVVLIPAMPNSDLSKFFTPLDDLGLNDKIYFKDFRSYEGKMYGIASGGGSVGIVYNKKAFAAAGVTELPTTLDQFYAAAEKLKANGVVPLASNFKDKWPLNTWFDEVPTLLTGDADYGNKRVDSDVPYTLDNAYGQTFTILKTMHERGYLEKDINSTNWDQSKKDLAQGKMGMFLLGNWVIAQIIDAGGNSDDIGFFPFPADNSGKVKATLGPDYSYAVNKDSKNIPVAKAFVKWMVEESGYEDFAGYIPVMKDKQPKLPQLVDFMASDATIIESVPYDSNMQAIENKAQFDKGSFIQEFILGDEQKVIDKYNKQWAAAKKSIVK